MSFSLRAAVLGSLLSLFSIGCAGPAYVGGQRTAPATAQGLTHQEGRLAAADGTQLFHQSWRSEAPATGKPRGTLILVHGLKDYGDRYGELAERLARKGFVVHAVDLRGHGDSAGDRVWVGSFDEYVDDLERFVAHVRQVEGEGPLFLFGHSMGGAIVTTFALERNPKVDGIILSAAALQRDEKVSSGLVGVTRFFGTVLPSLAVFELDDTQFSRDPKVVEGMKSDPLIYSGKAPARTARELLNAISAIDEKMEAFHHPVLLVHGSADTVTPPAGSRALHTRAKSTDKTLKIYDGLFHDLLHEPERAQVMDDIESWLAERAPAQPEANEAP